MDIKEYFEQLNERERRWLLVASIFLGLYLFYSLIYSPIKSLVQQKKVILQENKQTLQWMEQVYVRQKNIKPPESLSKEKLLTVLTNSLKTSKLKDFAYQLEQTSDEDIKLSFSKVPYNELVNWLWQFCGRYSLTVKLFSASSKDSSGVINVSVVLSKNTT